MILFQWQSGTLCISTFSTLATYVWIMKTLVDIFAFIWSWGSNLSETRWTYTPIWKCNAIHTWKDKIKEYITSVMFYIILAKVILHEASNKVFTIISTVICFRWAFINVFAMHSVWCNCISVRAHTAIASYMKKFKWVISWAIIKC